MATTIQGIGQIAITIRDLTKSIEFYRDAVGLQFLFQAGPTMAFFQCGDVRVMISTPEADGATYSSILYFRVADINTAASEMKARGVVFEREPQLIAKMPDHDLWMAFFRDPDRNVMALMSEVRAS
jgi:methylmalonyl-CoA/ethylmalonyl-CoA epimerase